MKRTAMIRLVLMFLMLLSACFTVLPRAWAALVAAEKLKLIPVEKKIIVEREKSLVESGPKGATLVAYLDCGSQQESTTTDRVKIAWASGEAYIFRSEATDVLPTQPTIFYDKSRVAFTVCGLDRSRRYLVGLTWWDYDASGRTQSVVVSSPDGRRVRLAVPGIGLPNYTTSGKPPAERRFLLPVSFSQDGKIAISVHLVTGANAVISELWIWELE